MDNDEIREKHKKEGRDIPMYIALQDLDYSLEPEGKKDCTIFLNGSVDVLMDEARNDQDLIWAKSNMGQRDEKAEEVIRADERAKRDAQILEMIKNNKKLEFGLVEYDRRIAKQIFDELDKYIVESKLPDNTLRLETSFVVIPLKHYLILKKSD